MRDVFYLKLFFYFAGTTCGLENDPNADLKSPISLVHEIALKRNLPVNFEVVSEKGPPHMRTFMTKCTVGDMVTNGEGNGKKVYSNEVLDWFVVVQ
jgi:double-stranded RNA-binding protein Staufen